jgi:hypothetical protein
MLKSLCGSSGERRTRSYSGCPVLPWFGSQGGDDKAAEGRPGLRPSAWSRPGVLGGAGGGPGQCSGYPVCRGRSLLAATKRGGAGAGSALRFVVFGGPGPGPGLSGSGACAATPWVWWVGAGVAAFWYRGGGRRGRARAFGGEGRVGLVAPGLRRSGAVRVPVLKRRQQGVCWAGWAVRRSGVVWARVLRRRHGGGWWRPAFGCPVPFGFRF